MDNKKYLEFLAKVAAINDLCTDDAEAIDAIKRMINKAETPQQMRRALVGARTLAAIRWE